MPLGPFGEVVGTTATLDALAPELLNYKTRVVAPRNPKLVRASDFPIEKLTPSKYLFNMSLNTQQKLANTHVMKIPRKTELLDMGDTSLQKFSKVNIDEPMFQPFPSEIFFQNFTPFEVYEVPLMLRNNDKVPRLVKVSQESSPYFKIISPNDVGHKVGPGLPTTFKVQFMPSENKDYRHDLICVTEREKFIVPVIAIGARGILDLPDEINLPTCPVKYSNTKTLLVRNIGNKEAKFSLKTKPPFFVTPAVDTLAVQDSMQVTIEFKPKVCGDHKGDLILAYDTGEELFINMYAAAQDTNVRLDKNTIRIDSTYISMANQKKVIISNRSDVIAHFRWSGFATQEEEDQQKLMQQIELDREENTDTDRFLAECVQDPTLRDKLSILSRTFQNRRKAVFNDPLLFQDDVLTIEPVEGDIWPNSTFEITVIFKPREATSYTRTAFCEVTGRESRMPLRVKGEGAGPKVDFSFEKLDMGNIFIGSKHTYEIVLANKGDIDAIYSAIPKADKFGPCFAFNPSEGIVMPGGHQAIEVAFCSPYLGEFDETFMFQIDGQPKESKINFVGRVVGPTINFDVAKLKFGTVPFGFERCQSCKLVNTSLIPLLFKLRILGDGVNKSICSTDYLDEESPITQPAVNPKEFELVPSTGLVPPHSELQITVKFVPNTIKKYDTALVVDVERVGETVLSLPISAKSLTPHVSNLTPILNYGRCFLRHPYENRIRLHNDSDLPAKYEIIPQSDFNEKIPPITYESRRAKDIIQPHTIANIPIIIKSVTLDEQEVPCLLKIFGSNDPPMVVHITCVGEGPVVHATPLALDWGDINVLQNVDKLVTLSNESYVPARFTACLLRSNTAFKVTPSEGVIRPSQSKSLTVTANLEDSIRFQDKLQISFHESPNRVIPLSATGKGTTITAEPPFLPVLNFGHHFCSSKLVKQFKVTNSGKRIQQLVWLTNGYIPLSKAKKEKIKQTRLNNGKLSPSSTGTQKPTKPVFEVVPNRMELNPGDSAVIKIQGYVDSPQSVSENLVCSAIIGRAGGKIPIISAELKAEFIEPLLDFSTKCACFRVDKAPNDELKIQQKEVVLTNVASLSLSMSFKLPHPFSMVVGEDIVSEHSITLAPMESYTLDIRFDPSYKPDRFIRKIEEVLQISYKNHPNVDTVALRGEVYFPNLEFEKNTVDFGCILNDTEVTRYVNITNNSPLEVKYKWFFIVGDGATTITKMARPKRCLTPEEVQLEEQLEKTEVALEEMMEEGEEKPQSETGIEKEEPVGTTEPEVDNAERNTNQSEQVEDNKADLNFVDDSKAEDAPEKGQLDEEGHGEKDVDVLSLSATSSPLSLTETKDGEPLHCNRVLAALLNGPEEATPNLGVEEVFDILPLYGTLQPGETELVTFTFYGHEDISGEVKAVCEVEGGPTYELRMIGQASVVEYAFDTKNIDYGKQLFDNVSTKTIKLMNTGKVGLDFMALNMDPGTNKRPPPGDPIMTPHFGYIAPFSEQVIEVKYLPGVPEKFTKKFQIQVAHFEPDDITICGEGVFPRFSLDLPRLLDVDGLYDCLMNEAYENLMEIFKQERELYEQTEIKVEDDIEEELMNLVSVEEATVVEESKREIEHTTMMPPPERVPTDLELQLEMERLAVRNFALESGKALHDMADDSYKNEGILQTVTSHLTMLSNDSYGWGKPRPILPDYVLDFGYVVLGSVRTHMVRATNTGYFPVSFKIDHQNIQQSGFRIELDKVKNLPGAPDNESFEFMVSCDPRGDNLFLGAVECVVPISIVSGPMIALRLRAHVTMPDMEVSSDVLEFGETKCGECKLMTVQLHNHQMVKCEWDSVPEDDEKSSITNKFVPMHLRRKMKKMKKKPRVFEVLPPTGVLMPGQRVNVQVKFMPIEERAYELRLPIRIAQSSQRILLFCKGKGLEPRLEFARTLVEFGPILPHCPGDEQTVVVRNPCPFPIEFYSLEFDKTYLQEERILRLMRGYDEYDTLLLPPREANTKLPPELTEFYDEQYKKMEEEEREKEKQKLREEAEAARLAALAAAEEEGEEAENEAKAPDGNATTNNAEPKTEDGLPAIHANGTVLTPNASNYKSSPTPQGSIVELTPEEQAKRDEYIEEKMKESINSASGVGELEITPVSAAIARHLGIDLTVEGKQARNRRGVAIIVHGAPVSGKSATAVELAKHYKAALLTVDGIVCDAISNGNTPAGLRAREMCSEVGKKRFEEMKEQEAAEEKKAILSIEAIAAHTQGTGGSSLAGHRKTSTVVDGKTKEKAAAGGKQAAAASSNPEGTTGSQVPSTPPPLLGPIAKRLSISASVAGEEGLVSCVLPEELLVEILADRLQLSDCHLGVVFDGMETLFSQNFFTTANAILKALNNRRFIYFCTLKLEFNVFKDLQRKKLLDKEAEEQRKEDEEYRWLEEMDEDEYDQLTDQKKEWVDFKRLEIKRQRIKREQELKAEKERLEREAREEEERRREEEKKSKGGKKSKNEPAKDKEKKSSTNVKTGQQTDRSQKPQGSAMERPESHLTEKSDNQTDDGKKKKDKIKKETKAEDDKDSEREAELLLMQRFRTFEASQKDIEQLLELWDRTTLQPRRPLSVSEKSEEDHAQVSKKGSKIKQTAKEAKEAKEEDKKKLAEKEITEKTSKETINLEGEEEQRASESEVKVEEELGVPNIIINCENRTIVTSDDLLKNLPNMQEDEHEKLDDNDNKTTEKQVVIEKPENPEKSRQTENVKCKSKAEDKTAPSEEEINIPDLLLTFSKLPPAELVLEGLGLGSQGPPIPPPAEFAVVPFPVKRKAPEVTMSGAMYTFVAAFPDDPNIEEKPKDPDQDEDIQDKSKDDQSTTPTKGKEKKPADKGRGSSETRLDRKKSAEKKKGNRRNSTLSPTSALTPPLSDAENQRLTVFRWIVPAGGERMLKLRFTSDDLGQFDQTLNFEIMGTRRRYQLFCRGVCSFPYISREPRTVFPARKRSTTKNEIVKKKYILSKETFDFGPLLVGKSRDRYRDGKYPENQETFTIFNSSPLLADISFCFLSDLRGDTYLLEPSNMTLKPGESSKLTVWAFPKGPGHFEDAIVVCVRDNPEPMIFKITCDGYRPELELDKKAFHFDKVLLHRKDTKSIFLRNSTKIPVAWRLSGLDNLGDEFTVAADSGVVEPLSEFPLQAYFRATKPVQTNKKMIRLDISDVDNIMGVVHTEPIQVVAEAYDVSLDMSFPKGTDGGLDFGTIRVSEEAKQTCTLKNKGKYEIAFNFLLENADPNNPTAKTFFTVVPSSGKLNPLDRPTQVQVIFKSSREITIKEKPILICQVIEPSLGEQGEVIANIPVKVSVRALFSKFCISPSNDINFGALLIQSKKSRTFLIENKGDFDFKYTITKRDNEAIMNARNRPKTVTIKQAQKKDTKNEKKAKQKKEATESEANINENMKRIKEEKNFKNANQNSGRKSLLSSVKGDKAKSRDDSSSAPSVKPKKTDSLSSMQKVNLPNITEVPNTNNSMKNVNNSKFPPKMEQEGAGPQSKLTLGMFTLFPAFGIILPGGSQVITVDCVGETKGKDAQDLSIDISERDPSTFKGGIPYQLFADVCVPAINIEQISGIFEEHRICKNLTLWANMNCGLLDSEGVYGEDENRYLFNNVLVGQSTKARFKIINSHKVPCDVTLQLKPTNAKGATKSLEMFEIQPTHMQISNHGFMYAVVTFSPQAMQSYSAVFEANVEASTNAQVKGKPLTFEIYGEGTLPRITIAKPSVRNKRGQPLMLFKKTLITRTDVLPLELVNEGTLASKVTVSLNDPDKCFSVALLEAKESQALKTYLSAKGTHSSMSVIVLQNERVEFEVTYKPTAKHRSQANILVSVLDNQYEDSSIQLVGEGYQDDITLDNIGSVFVPVLPELEPGSMADDDVADTTIDKKSSSLSESSKGSSQLIAEIMSAAKSNVMQFGDCFINKSRTLNLTMTNHSKSDCMRFEWPTHEKFTFSPKVGHLHANCAKDIAVTYRSEQPETLVESPLQCTLTKITFDRPIDEVCDWDDKLQVIKWVDMYPPANVQTTPSDNGSKSQQAQTTPVSLARKKVTETEEEPAHTEIPESTRTIELLVSAVTDFVQCSCDLDKIHFKDTLMFQTRVFKVKLKNEGHVTLDYQWQVVMNSIVPSIQRSVTFMSEGDRPESRVDMVESDYAPFEVEPTYGSIPSGGEGVCIVKFTPLDENDHEGKLICSIPYMKHSQQGPVVEVKGKSLMPFCHFDLDDCDYLSSNRRNPELRGPKGAPPGSTLDPNTRVLEFHVTGLGVKSLKSFGIVNPTSETFKFEWICEDEKDPKNPISFRCLHPEGEIKSGRNFKAGFEFVSKHLGLVESFWRFVIPSQNISVPFLLVGRVKEPNICIDRSHFNFKSLLLGREASETIYLYNGEDMLFDFHIVPESCYSEGSVSHLKVEPMSGNIPPLSNIPIKISICPNTETEASFNVVIKIKHKDSPLTLNVKAEGYRMTSVLQCEDSQGNRVELSSKGRNQINFGEVEVNETELRYFYLINTGKYHFEYSWKFADKAGGGDAVSISPDVGSVTTGGSQQILLSFCPKKRVSVNNCEIILNVINGPSYQISILGLGVHPGVYFSFRSFNFGNCFLHKPGFDVPPKKANLKITNKDTKEISLECLYQPTPYLSCNTPPKVLAVGETLKFPFTFSPRVAKTYHETVLFEVNGHCKHKIEFTGTGTELKIEVVDPKMKCINLGSKVVGDLVKRIVPIVNNSPAPVTFNLAFTPTEKALRDTDALSISPREKVTLNPHGDTMKVEVLFRPKARIPQFTEEVLLECSGISQPVFVLKGSCLGMEINLDSDAVSFGTVYQRSSSYRKLIMYNTGDMNSKFCWDIKRFGPDFSISPVEGYITPGSEVAFDVEFHPQQVSQDIRYDNLRCYLDSRPKEPLSITLSGMCTDIPPVKEVQTFQAVVRQTDVKQIMIPNKSNQVWQLKPIIDGEYWTGAVTFRVDPQQTKYYELTYLPLTMTTENRKHNGSIYFPLPDGTAIFFHLTGTAEPPKVINKIQQDVPCKTAYTELLTVSNWLKKPQRFKVKIEPLKPDKLDVGTTVQGVGYIDVPANASKDYKLQFFAYKEGVTTVKITFINEKSGEYQFYEATFRASRPGIISNIVLSTPVRQCVPYTLAVENPLPDQVVFSISCSVSEVLLPSQLVVPANSQGQITLEYMPLKVGEVEGRLELTCNELGIYTYDMNLTATQAAPEKALHFRTTLGLNSTNVAKFHNYAKQKTDYTCKIENQDFHVDKSVTAAPGSSAGTEVAVEITFEPSRLGEQRALLVVSSQTGGEYEIPLFGSCAPPKPQGPFVIKAGSSTPIVFRNVFSSTTPFTFQIDNPLFHLTKRGESIRARKDHRIVVGFDGNDTGSKSAVMGKLIVSCANSAGGNSNAQWIFYLKGTSSN